MSEPRKPDVSSKTVAANRSSRTVVIVVVALLIAVAIAGIVLAGRKNSAPTAEAPGSTAPMAVTAPVEAGAASTPVAGTAPTEGSANEVIFVAGSDKMPASASAKIARVVEQAKADGKSVRISARYLTGANKTTDLELAKARTTAIRHAVSADGLTGAKIQTELIEMPAGALAARDGDRIELSLR